MVISKACHNNSCSFILTYSLTERCFYRALLQQLKFVFHFFHFPMPCSRHGTLFKAIDKSINSRSFCIFSLTSSVYSELSGGYFIPAPLCETVELPASPRAVSSSGLLIAISSYSLPGDVAWVSGP